MHVKDYFAVGIIGLITLLASANARANSIVVNSLVDPSVTNKCTLHDAIAAANTRTAVNGCVAGSGNDVITFKLTGLIVLRETLPDIQRTLAINGPSKGIEISGNGAIQIMVIDTTAVVSLSNLTLANGVGGSIASGTGVGGGAIDNEGALSVNLCSFNNNSAVGVGKDAQGAAIFNGGSLKLSNSSFVDNSASANGTLGPFGGAVTLAGSGPATINNCKFVGNTVSATGDASGAAGGAIAQVTIFPVTIENSTFTDNMAIAESGGVSGGAIYQGSPALITIKNCTFTNNSAASDSGGAVGGALGSGGPNIEIDDSTFTGNSASSQSGLQVYGGAVFAITLVTISADTFVANTVSGGPGSMVFGGGAASAGGQFSVINSTFYKNTASGDMATEVVGGGVGVLGESSVFFSTFLDNSATNTDGSVLGGNFGAGDTSPTGLLANSILAGAGAGGNCGGMFVDSGYNISDDGSCAFTTTGSRNNTNPNLASAPFNNGGPTQTIALKPGSPAIDAIRQTLCVDSNNVPVTVDQRGKPRPDPEDGPSGPCDIGAYEYQQPPLFNR